MSDEPEESAYYLRLVSMYMDLGTETVLNVFVYHSPGKDPETFLKSKEETLVKLKTDRILNKQECELLFNENETTDKRNVKNILKSQVDIKRFDISLIITLSINLFTEQQLQPPRKGWDNPPRNNDKSIAADLLRLRTIRNVIVGHHSNARLPKWRFDEEWKNVSEILLRLQQQISRGNETIVKEKIEAYRLQIHVSPLEQKYEEKLRGWQEEVSKAQDQKIEGFDAYFIHKCDRYERYTKLLIKGGRFVLLSLLDEQVRKQGKDIRSILDENKDALEGGITDSKDLDILFPSETTSPIDMSSWNVSMIATVILQLFEKSIGRATKRVIEKIDDAFKNYAENAIVALDSNTFEDYSTDLKASLEIVSGNLDEDQANQYNQILVDSKRKIGDREFQTYMDELKTQGTQIKRMTDIFKETLQKTKDCLRDMTTCGTPFKKSHDLELKMITLGNNEEKKILAEEILTEIWLEALDRSTQTSDFADVKKEVEKIIKEIKTSKSVTNIAIKTACIILQISCTSPGDMLHIISYFDSTEFLEALVNISKELGYYFNTALSVYSAIPIECLMGVLNCDPAEPAESGIRLPITVSSPAGMLQLRSLFNNETIANSTNVISDALSKHLDEKITLEVSTDMKVFSSVFDEDDSFSDSSSSESTLTSSTRLQQIDKPCQSPEERSKKNKNEVSTEENTAENPMNFAEDRRKLSYSNKLLSSHKEEIVYVETERGLQKRLMKPYRDNVFKVPTLPIQLEGNQELTQVPTQLNKLSIKIRSSQISGEINWLVPLGTECVHSFADAFNNEGNAVLAQHERLVRAKCPSKVEVENLSESIQNFQSSLQKGNDKAVQLRTKIHDAVESSKDEKRRNEHQISEKKIEITGLEEQIKQKDTAISEYEEDARKIEQGANELERRARRLRRRSDRHRDDGVLWGVFSLTVGLVFTPFTGGASMGPALAAAGIGAKINYDSAQDCDRNAHVMRSKAQDKRDEAIRQRKKKDELESEKREKRNEIQDRERAIGELADTCRALVELEGYLLQSIRTIGQATRIVQDFERALHESSLQGDAFELLQECFIDDPEEFHDEVHAEMKKLKEQWDELERLIIRYSDRRGIAF